MSDRALARLRLELRAARTPAQRRRIRQTMEGIRLNPLKASPLPDVAGAGPEGPSDRRVNGTVSKAVVRFELADEYAVARPKCRGKVSRAPVRVLRRRPAELPRCGGTEFYNGEPIVWLRVAWGLAVAQRPVPGFDYEVGDRIRWRSCIDGTVLPWTFFRDRSVNIGGPEFSDVIVVDRSASTCPACGAVIGGGALEIRGGRIEAARLFLEGEFGEDDLVDVFQLSPDGSWSPLPAPSHWGWATSECGPIEAIEQIPRAAVAVLLPPPSRHWDRRSSIPQNWFGVLREWVAPTGKEPVWGAFLGTEVQLAPDGMKEFAERHEGTVFLSGQPAVGESGRGSTPLEDSRRADSRRRRERLRSLQRRCGVAVRG